MASSHVHAGPPPKAAGQLLGGMLRRAVVPAVPVALGRVARRAALDEPRVLVGGVVGDPVQEHAEVARVRLGEQRVEGREVAEERIDVAVVGHVVAEVGHRRAVDRRQPDRVDAEPLQVLEARAEAVEVADAVARRVGERARVDLVDDGLLPPHAVAKATDRRRRRPVRVAAMTEVQRIGVVGGGFMGSGIAESAARAGVAVAIYEPEAAPLEHSRTSIEGSVARAVQRGKLSEDEAGALVARIDWSTDLDALAEAELVVEAIVEDEEVKARTFAALDGVVGAETILASNTSSIPIARAGGRDRSSRPRARAALLLAGARHEARRGRGRPGHLRRDGGARRRASRRRSARRRSDQGPLGLHRQLLARALSHGRGAHVRGRVRQPRGHRRGDEARLPGIRWGR